jgi:predicted enzyme related to lactoylglutathione lyase
MPTMTQHAPGTFCWPELGTTDQAAAKKFYTSLFGWTFEDNDMGAGGIYTMLKLNGQSVGALYALGKEMLDHGVPPHWGSYVAVESADAAAEKAKTLGATILGGPFDVMDVGRMAVIQDPTGATFSVWQAKKHAGANVLDEPGALCWTELMTTDAAKAKRFYTGLLPWTPESMPMGPPEKPMEYTVFKNAGKSAAGMMQITPEMGPVPPHWMIYFMVENCDASASKAHQLGAKTLVPPTDIPNVGRFAVVMDPQGAPFAMLAFPKQG